MYPWLLSLVLSLVLSGCGSLLQADYQSPLVDVPAHWRNHTTTGSDVTRAEKWWSNFDDPILTTLIDRVLYSNNDLAAAAIKVRRARLQVGVSDANLLPTVSVNSTGSVSQNVKTSSASSKTYNATASLSYELDLWGRLARLQDVAMWEAQATEWDRQSTALTLIGTTAQLYWQIAYLNQRITAHEISLANAHKTWEIARLQYDAGAANGLGKIQAEQYFASQQTSLAALVQQREEARNGLAILFDQAPQSREVERKELPDHALPDIPVGIPASVLARRPDLQAAESRLKESFADVEAKRANFYPIFSLTGSVGGASISLASVLSNPIGVLGVGLALPFVQWHTTQLTLKVSQNQYEEAVVHFRQALYKAFADVENALSARDYYRQQDDVLRRTFLLAQRAEQLVEIRYRAGQTGVKEWLDQQESRRNTENALAENRYNQLNNLMKLWQALGGGVTVQ